MDCTLMRSDGSLNLDRLARLTALLGKAKARGWGCPDSC